MKKALLSLTAAVALLIAAPASAFATSSESASTSMPVKKKTTKKSTKKSTKKTSSKSKKSTKSTTTTTTATTDNSSSAQGGLLSAVSSLFGGSSASTETLAGTWKYTQPAVVFESSDALKNLGGKLASAAVEKKLQTELQKYGITKGKFKMTFDKDGNFTQTVGTKTVSGTYKLSGKNVVLTYASGLQQLVGKTELDGNNLLIVMDASKFMKYAGTLGKLTGNATISTLSSILGSYDGMQVGLRFAK